MAGLLWAFACLGAGAAAAAPDATASKTAPVTQSGITVVSATASPDTIQPGETVTFTVALQGPAKGPLVVDLELRSASDGKLLSRKLFGSLVFASKKTYTYTWQFTTTATTPEGSYDLSVLTYELGNRLFATNKNVTSVTIGTTPVYYGVNLADGAAGMPNGVYGEDYIYPQTSDMDYWHSKKLDLIRLFFRWERVQPALGGTLDGIEIARIKAVTADAAKRGMRVILDVHNFGQYQGRFIGSPDVPVSAYTGFLGQLAAAFKDDPGVYGYDIMNQPSPVQPGAWPPIAQAGVNAVRAQDGKKLIFVQGECGSLASKWATCNAALNISDPANKVVYAAQEYFGSDESELYSRSYDVDQPSPTVGAERLKPFLGSLKARKARGLLFAYTYPNDDPRWQPIMQNFMKTLQANCLSGTYYLAGVTTANQRISIQPVNGADKPQTSLLQQYPDIPACKVP